MAGGKGKSTGGKAGPKEAAGKSQKSHSAKAGLQVSTSCFMDLCFVFERAQSMGRARAGLNHNIFQRSSALSWNQSTYATTKCCSLAGSTFLKLAVAEQCAD